MVCLLVIPIFGGNADLNTAEFRVQDKKDFCFVRSYDGITGQRENN